VRAAAGPSGPSAAVQRAGESRASEPRRDVTRLVVGITGATGAELGVRLLEVLGDLDGVETHLVMSRWARATIELETRYTARQVAKLADVAYSDGDQAAAISSGSFITAGMVVIPCSMKTLAGIRAGYADGLLGRAADVTIKERRALVLVPRETPLSVIHLENMLALARMGVAIVPPMPAFYNHPETVGDIVDHFIARVLDQFGLASQAGCRWAGLAAAQQTAAREAADEITSPARPARP
jgi:flavin prenyltransferase